LLFWRSSPQQSETVKAKVNRIREAREATAEKGGTEAKKKKVEKPQKKGEKKEG